MALPDMSGSRSGCRRSSTADATVETTLTPEVVVDVVGRSCFVAAGRVSEAPVTWSVDATRSSAIVSHRDRRAVDAGGGGFSDGLNVVRRSTVGLPAPLVPPPPPSSSTASSSSRLGDGGASTHGRGTDERRSASGGDDGVPAAELGRGGSVAD